MQGYLNLLGELFDFGLKRSVLEFDGVVDSDLFDVFFILGLPGFEIRRGTVVFDHFNCESVFLYCLFLGLNDFFEFLVVVLGIYAELVDFADNLGEDCSAHDAGLAVVLGLVDLNQVPEFGLKLGVCEAGDQVLNRYHDLIRNDGAVQIHSHLRLEVGVGLVDFGQASLREILIPIAGFYSYHSFVHFGNLVQQVVLFRSHSFFLQF